MNVKKTLAAGTAALVLAGSALPASAAGIDSDYVNALKENGTADLILNVEAYRTAYSNLDAAFGDDTNAYLMHYLTTGMYEGRTIGVLFNPLAYAEAYSDIKEAFGDDISAVVNHYVTSGIAENRTAGTAGSYADLAEAEREEAQKAGNTESRSMAAAYSSTGGSAAGNNSNATGNSAAGNGSNTTGNSNATAGSPDNSPAAENTTTTGSSSTGNTANVVIHRNVRHYADDEVTLRRVEYYDANNKLVLYSVVTDFDSAALSYTEHIYSCDNVLVRTDTYVNGTRVSSVSY